MNAIITGATKGIGRATALKLAEAGYNLAVCARSQSELDSFCDEINERFGVHAIGYQADCAIYEQVLSFAGFVQQHFQKVDVLINNAGIYRPSAMLDEPDDNFLQQMQVNLYPAYYLCKIFGKQMRDNRSGNIINICSVAAVKPVVKAGSYTVTKIALLGLTKVLREELMQHGVKVTAILPGSTLTESWEGTDLPQSRFVLPDDIANAVLTVLKMSAGANIDELIIRPLQGEI